MKKKFIKWVKILAIAYVVIGVALYFPALSEGFAFVRIYVHYSLWL